MRNYILICSPIERYPHGIVGGLEVIKKRSVDKIWPIYKNTRNRKRMKKDDNLIFYVSGTGKLAQNFVASGHAGSAVQGFNIDDPESWISERANTGIKVSQFKFFVKPVPIRDILKQLEFIKGSKKWGAYLQGGCVELTEADYKLIMGLGKKAL